MVLRAARATSIAHGSSRKPALGQDQGRGLAGEVGGRADRDADIGRGEHRPVVEAVADHRDAAAPGGAARWPAACPPATGRPAASIPTLGGDPRCRRRESPVRSTVMPSPAGAAPRRSLAPRRAAPRRARARRAPARPSRHGPRMARLASQAARTVARARRDAASRARPAMLPIRPPPARPRPCRGCRGRARATLARRRRRDAALGGRGRDRPRQRMLRMPLEPGGARKHLVRRRAVASSMPTRRGLPAVERAGLVEGDQRARRASVSSTPPPRTRQPRRASRPMPSEVATARRDRARRDRRRPARRGR